MLGYNLIIKNNLTSLRRVNLTSLQLGSYSTKASTAGSNKDKLKILQEMRQKSDANKWSPKPPQKAPKVVVKAIPPKLNQKPTEPRKPTPQRPAQAGDKQHKPSGSRPLKIQLNDDRARSKVSPNEFKPRPSAPKRPQRPKQKTRELYLPEYIKVANLSRLLGVKYDRFKRTLVRLGLPDYSPDYTLNSEDASLIAMEYNCTPIVDQVQGKDLYPREKPSDPTKYPLRPPVVTIMGHVDHGKTTLLDKLRNSSIAAGEAGGITQHIGAFSVITKSKNNITFLDTPGHAAFSQMRARGANTTDIVVLVVAIDDGIMPQTVEAIKHAQEAEVPIIVAITKCDKHNNNLEQIKIDFVQHGVYLEESGGEVPLVKLSAVTGEGIDELEETILAVSEVLDVRADPKGLTQATVLESRIDKGLGNIASVLVNYGTLKPGQLLVAGTASGKVRLIFDEHGKQIKSALPGTPVQITGWKTLPNAGEYALEAKDEDEVKVVIANRERDLERKKEMEQIEAINEQKQQLHELSKIKQQNKALGIEEDDDKRTYQPKTPEKPCLNVILKGDVFGTVEAISEALTKLPTKKVDIKIAASGVGPATKADVDVAIASKGVILTFGVPNLKEVKSLCKAQFLPLLEFKIIYRLLDEVKKRMLELVPDEFVTEVVSEVEVKQIFEIDLKGKKTAQVAGSLVTKGNFNKSNPIKVLRKGQVIHEGTITQLRHFKDEVEQVHQAQECGVQILEFQKLQPGDIIQSYTQTQLPKKLE